MSDSGDQPPEGSEVGEMSDDVTSFIDAGEQLIGL